MQRCIHLRTVSCSPKELLEIKKSDDIIYFFAAGDVSRETSLAAKSEEKRMFSQATLLVTRVQFYPLYRYLSGICQVV